MIIAEAGYRIQDYFHIKQAEFLAFYEHGILNTGNKIWLSRSKLTDSGGFLEEPQIEEKLQSLGWIIFHPQEHTVSEQLAILASAHRVAGIEGSAFHIVALFKQFQGQIDIFIRGKQLNGNYRTIANRKNFKQYEHVIEKSCVKNPASSRALWSVSNVSNIINLLTTSKDNFMSNSFDNDASKTVKIIPGTHSPRRINKLLESCNGNRYLEIGVAEGKTFFNVNSKEKVAVDPHFRFEYITRTTKDIRFYEMTSDDFFCKDLEKGRFDIIMVDGLHTFEQTFRDFCASLSLAHDRTIWLIDDTVPNDVFSAIPNQREAISFRKKFGGKSNAWHGDVFKVIFAINDFFPCFQYRTISTDGNSQTIVWRASRPNFQPKFNSLEKISRLDFFDLHQNFNLMNARTEEEVLDEINEIFQKMT
ncbi:MAG: DUF563 domain-containing protein [Methylococcaceae bacterium]|nr:DUF563 domain-containing protein [Methylococcaceae bacterium]